MFLLLPALKGLAVEGWYRVESCSMLARGADLLLLVEAGAGVERSSTLLLEGCRAKLPAATIPAAVVAGWQ